MKYKLIKNGKDRHNYTNEIYTNILLYCNRDNIHTKKFIYKYWIIISNINKLFIDRNKLYDFKY